MLVCSFYPCEVEITSHDVPAATQYQSRSRPFSTMHVIALQRFPELVPRVKLHGADPARHEITHKDSIENAVSFHN